MAGHKRKRVLIRKSTASLLLIPLTIFAYGQTHRCDSLKLELVNARDTVRPFLLNGLAKEINDSISLFPSNQRDSLLQVAKNYVIEAEALSRKLNYNSGIGTALILSGDIKVNQALRNFDKSITDYTNALPYLRASKDLTLLNFVNNFAEVNNELIEEMNKEDDINEIKTIANDIKQNNEKISFHGKRADAIVKGMLQHSRASTGLKEPTDINKLADEYLRLAYHGLRAKDKSFSVEVKTDFDSSINKINVVPQDIGRVLLNLINNALYAAGERKKESGSGYEPIVMVSTQKNNDKVKIKISDNGDGIPENIVDKIFQPFFTTKPTGQGTGLGLSLAYDIVKAHGGEIKVETKEGEGSEFIVQLPII